ncbi:MAG TPA: alpha/beta hydrolase [Acidimicrobiia bacterium]|nr:alpha/beta hydrolase [Acidimicrobiia bacterium]
MRARHPDLEGTVERDGVTLGYEVFGQGSPTILLMPTWTIIHTRFWKMQIPYLSRYYQVVTYDGPGNGTSDRVTDPARYAADSYAADAAAVLDACGEEQAVVVGLSLGGQYAVRLAKQHPARVMGIVLVGPALPLAPSLPERAAIPERMHQPYPDDPQGWDKYNIAYWHDHYQDFVEFFFDQCFSEPHSTKSMEDAVGWALETGPEVLEAVENRPLLGLLGGEIFEGVSCPTLVIHGTADRIQPYQTGVEAALLTEGTLVSMGGSGHFPNVRDPVRFNLALRVFVDRLAA